MLKHIGLRRLFARFATGRGETLPWAGREQMRGAGGVREMDRYDDYLAVGRLQDVLGAGDRIFSMPGLSSRLPPPIVHSGTPRLPLLKWRTNRGIAARFVRIDDALVLRSKQIVNLRTGKLVVDSVRKPAGRLNAGVLLSERERRQLDFETIDAVLKNSDTPLVSDAFCAFSQVGGFGHILLEGISQLWPLADGLKLPADVRFLVNRTRSGFHFAHFEALGVGADRLIPVRDALRVKGLLLASQSFVLVHGVSDRFFKLAEAISAHFGRPPLPPLRLYVSRRFAGKRRLLNEARIEALFARHQFQVIHPENLPSAEQIRLFAHAEWVAGPVGSGLYNSAFSPARCRRIILAPASFFTANDLLLSRGDSPLYLLDGRGATDRKQAISDDWQIDERNVERCLTTLFDGASPEEGFESIRRAAEAGQRDVGM